MFWLLATALCFAAHTAVAAGAQPTLPKPVDTTVQIESSPPGAFVLMSPFVPLQREGAVALGKTPLLRLLPVADAGASIQITKAGFQPWNGRLLPGAGAFKAELIPLTDEQQQALGWFVSPPSSRLVVVPMRLGIHKVGRDVAAFQTGTDATSFSSRFLNTFGQTMGGRLANTSFIQPDAHLATDPLWEQLQRQTENLHVETIGYNPAPIRLKFSSDIETNLTALDGAVLLLRAEAYYRGSGATFVKGMVPILLTAGSAAGGAAVAQATGASFYTYNVYGGSPSSDTVLVQMFLVHSATKELLWFGQVTMPAYFKHEQVVENTARKAAEQVPSAFLKKSDAAP